MARVDLGWKDGRRVYKAIYGRTRREVADELNQALGKAKAGTLSADERQTVADCLRAWLQHKAATLSNAPAVTPAPGSD